MQRTAVIMILALSTCWELPVVRAQVGSTERKEQPMDTISLKWEKEFRIAAEEVPEPALDFVQGLEQIRKLHWYREEHQSGYSFEAKFKLRGCSYSAEFDAAGQLEDLEFNLDHKTLDQQLLEKIQAALSASFKGIHIKKVQEQWSGEDAAIRSALLQQSAAGVVRRYEVEFSARREYSADWYEALFEANGDLIRVRLIIQKGSEHLVY